jgi:hypothetical protein
MNKSKPLPVPHTNKPLMAIAGVLLLAPITALLWVSSYARVEPLFLGFPFFIWYQFLWVILCPACTVAAFALVRRARPAPKENP